MREADASLIFSVRLTAQKESSSAAAENIEQIAQTQIGTGIPAKGKAPEIARLLPVSNAAVFHEA